MRRTRITGAVALAAGLAAALAAPGPARAQGQSCADCCKLPCIEARIWEARFMKGLYKRLAATRGLTQAQYETREEDNHRIASFMAGMYVGANKACEWTLPDRKDPIAMRQIFHDTGFGLAESGDVQSWNLTLKVSDETCDLTHPRGAEVLPTITPCDGIGRATVAHEQKHIDDCKAWKKRGGGALTPAQSALREVAGYEAEIAELEKVRRQAAEPCTKKSCETNQLRFDIAARNFGTDIRHILGLDKKPPSKSPLARSRRGQ